MKRQSKFIQQAIELLDEAVKNLEKATNYSNARKRYWKSKKGKAVRKKRSDKLKHKPTVTNITESQLDSNDYIRKYHQRYRNHRIDQMGRTYWDVYSIFYQMRKKGIVAQDMQFKEYCKQNNIVFKTTPITWNKGDK